MENGNNKNKKELSPSIEEMDPDFLKELNNITKQLKTDQEIMNDYKPKHQSELEPNNYNISKDKNDISSNINNINDINNLNNDINMNENLFKEDFNNLKENDYYNDFISQSFQSLESINTLLSRFNSLLNKTQKSDNKNGQLNEKEEKILTEILDFLIESGLLKDTILNMKNEIENSFENSRNKLKKEEIEKYEEAIKNADIILNETNNNKPNKDLIMDYLYKLQELSNSLESMPNKN